MTRNHVLTKKTNTGFPCPACGLASAVVDSRPHIQGWKRRRGCKCGHRFNTFESVFADGTHPAEILRRLLHRLDRTSTELSDIKGAVMAVIGQEQAVNTEAAE